LTFRTARAALSRRVLASVVFVAVAAVAFVNLFIVLTSEALAVAFVVSALLYFAAPFAVVRDIATRRSVDQETVFGGDRRLSVCRHGFRLHLPGDRHPATHSVFRCGGARGYEPGAVLQLRDLDDDGYGNLVPATNPGQSLAVMEAVLGQLFLVTAVAKIITAWKPRRWGGSEGPE
jgi:hypothetical protein